MKRNQVRFTAAAAAMMIAAGACAVPAAAELTALRGGNGSIISEKTAERSEREMISQTMNSNYLLPDSDTYYISEADISWMDDTDLMLARNEFYARRGRKFTTKSIREYFERQGWYQGTIDPDRFSPDIFNRYEQTNIDFIVAYEKKREQQRKEKKNTPQEVTVLEQFGSSLEEEDEYAGIVDLYSEAIQEDWSEEELSLYGVNELTEEMETPENVGYVFMDLNSDGTEEMLIGPVEGRGYGKGAVFAIYEMVDGEPVEVASSEKDGMFYICEEGVIRREKIYGDGKWEIDYYDLDDGDLVLRDLLVMDESRNAAKPWFKINNAELIWEDSDPDAEELDWIPDGEYKQISSKKASEFRASYVAQELQFMPME